MRDTKSFIYLLVEAIKGPPLSGDNNSKTIKSFWLSGS